MSTELAVDVWEELKRYINTIDHADAADTLVSVMIDHDYTADDILQVFFHDSDIKHALNSYLTTTDEFDKYDDDDFGYED
jgi:hypothetical protein